MINLEKVIPLIKHLQLVSYKNPSIGLICKHEVYGTYKLDMNQQHNALFGLPLDTNAEYYWNNRFDRLSKEKQKERANELFVSSSTWDYIDEYKLCYFLLMGCGEWSFYDPELEKAKKIKEFEAACYKLNIGPDDFRSLLKYYEPIKDVLS